MIINNILDDIISNLSSVKPLNLSKSKIQDHIPSFRIEEIKNQHKQNICRFLSNFLQEIKRSHLRYDKFFEENIIKRKEYVTNTLNLMNRELENLNKEYLLNLKSKIDFIKSQKFTKIDKIFVNKEDTIKILKFLNKMNLENEFDWMEDFLKRKVIFEIEIPSELEIINLRKMINLLQISN